MIEFTLPEVPYALDDDVAGLVAKQMKGRHKPPSEGVFFKLESRAIRRYQLEAYVEGHRFISDEAQRAGGTGTGPAPLRFFVGGVVMCLQVWIIKTAAFRHVPLRGLQIQAETFHDHGSFDMDEDGSFPLTGNELSGDLTGARGFGRIELTVCIKTDWQEEDDRDREIISVIAQALRSCPAAVTASRGCELSVTVVHNDRVLNES